MQNFSGQFSLLSKASKFSSSSLNPLNMLPEKYMSRVRKDIEDFSGVVDRCEQMWQTVIKTEMIKFPFGLTVINKIFRKHEGDIYKYTKISSIEQFMSIFDVDKDNCLNEDQLISVFIYIKNKTEAVANDAIQIQAYSVFKDLMKQVRQLEAKITEWQDILRTKINKDQFDEYREIGDVKIDQFCQRYEGLFERLELTKDDRRWQLEKKFITQNQDLEAKLSDPLTLVKIKPNNKIKQLQLREKLVCLEERVDEAINYRTQLNKLQVAEEAKVNTMIQYTNNAQRNLLKFKQQKESQQLQAKLSQLEAKLKIQMQKQYNVLIKRNKLHENQIKKLHSMARRVGFKKGIEEPELHRTKKIESIKNSLLSNYKKNNEIGSRLLTQTIDLPCLKSQMSIDDATFNLNERQARVRNKSERMKTVHKYLETGEKEKAFPLCDMYNKSLMEISNPEKRMATKMSMMTDGSKKKTILQKIRVEM